MCVSSFVRRIIPILKSEKEEHARNSCGRAVFFKKKL
jgi:hypothetical protein